MTSRLDGRSSGASLKRDRTGLRLTTGGRRAGRPRPRVEYREEDYIVDEDAWVILSRDGWIKRQKSFTDVASIRVRDDDRVGWIYRAKARHTLTFFTDRGIGYTMRVERYPADNRATASPIKQGLRARRWRASRGRRFARSALPAGLGRRCRTSARAGARHAWRRVGGGVHGEPARRWRRHSGRSVCGRSHGRWQDYPVPRRDARPGLDPQGAAGHPARLGADSDDKLVGVVAPGPRGDGFHWAVAKLPLLIFSVTEVKQHRR